MTLTWHFVRQRLSQSARSVEFRRDFDAIRRTHKQISCFGGPAALVEALHCGTDSPAQKNQLLTTLTQVAQSNRPEADCAFTVIMLALWPGLSAVLSRSKRRCFGSPDELTSDILAKASEAIRRLDLDRVRRPAATIVRNIERDLVRAVRRAAHFQSLHADIDPDEFAIVDQTVTSNELQRDLHRMIGNDANLVFHVAVEGFSQAEMASELGLSDGATRKRYQRAARRLRHAFLDFNGPVSRLSDGSGFLLTASRTGSPEPPMTFSIIRPSRVCLIMTAADLCAWLAEATPGSSLEYHRGFLALDANVQSGRLCESESAELRCVAERARRAVDQGTAHLCQRRHGTDDYSYLLIARPRRGATPAQTVDSSEEAVAIADRAGAAT